MINPSDLEMYALVDNLRHEIDNTLIRAETWAELLAILQRNYDSHPVGWCMDPPYPGAVPSDALVCEHNTTYEKWWVHIPKRKINLWDRKAEREEG